MIFRIKIDEEVSISPRNLVSVPEASEVVELTPSRVRQLILADYNSLNEFLYDWGMLDGSKIDVFLTDEAGGYSAALLSQKDFTTQRPETDTDLKDAERWLEEELESVKERLRRRASEEV